MVNNFKILVGREEISGFVLAKNSEKANIVFIHGAGIAGKDRIKGYMDDLSSAGNSILAFDFSGHGESSGRLSESSLKKRVTEAKAIIEKYADKDNLTLIGSSMGCYVTLKLLETYNVKNIILFAPAIYDRAAYDVPFDTHFTEIIRKPDSWQHSDALDNIKKFAGNFLIFCGDKDKTIPKALIQMLELKAETAQKKEVYWVKEADHGIHMWLLNHPDELGRVNRKILQFLGSK